MKWLLTLSAVLIFGMANARSEALVIFQEEVVFVKSMTLSTNTEIGSLTADLEFEPDAVITTNGFNLTINARRIFGKNATIRTHPSQAQKGKDGEHGSGTGASGVNGSPGLPGANAGVIVLKAEEFTEAQGDLTILGVGQRGGDGGDGGSGIVGPPGRNGRGPDVSDCWIGNCRRSGEDGGPGGRGGNAGYGGACGSGSKGATVVLAIKKGDEHIKVTIDGGSVGKRGNPGSAGRGGPGGRGGNGHLCCGGGVNGPTGPSGSAGRPGAACKKGEEGTLVRITQ